MRRQRHECSRVVPVDCVHDEILVECDKRDAVKVETWLTKAMVDGMDEVLNGPEAKDPHVPVEVKTQVAHTWAG